MKIGLIVAIKPEADRIALALGLTQVEVQDYSYCMYTNPDNNIIMLTPGADPAFIAYDNQPVCRAGKVSAGIITTILIERYHPDVIINCGTAAGIATNNVHIGDIVVANAVANHDIHIPLPGYDAYGIRKITLKGIELFERITFPYKQGTVSSGESFTSGSILK